MKRLALFALFLLLASYVFYALWRPAFCLLLLAPRAGPASPSYILTKLGEARPAASNVQQ